jgi:hypothetical protein
MPQQSKTRERLEAAIQATLTDAADQTIWVKLRYKSPTQRLEREAVLRVMGASRTRPREIQLDARPFAGTQAMPIDWITKWTRLPRVPKEPYLDKVIR